MSAHHQLSLRDAILININIMLGAGLFINMNVLAQNAGILGALSYVIVGVLMLPLIVSMMQLLKLHPAGGLYTFGLKELNPFAGFISAWSYATGKLASTVIMIHSSMLFLQQIFPQIALINPLWLDAAIITLFIGLNMFDIKTGSKIQSMFLGLKLIPVFFGIFTGLFLWGTSTPTMLPLEWEGIPFTLPLVLFAIIGFEAACALSSRIENASYNAPRAIMISYTGIILASTLFQLSLSLGLGTFLSSLAYRQVFPALFGTALPNAAHMAQNLTIMAHLAIISSALGGSYGIIFSNTWNWYTLAQHGHLFGSAAICKLNQYHIPSRAVLIQGAICFLYLIVTLGKQLPLQQTSTFGVTIAYTISAWALIVAARKRTDITLKKWVPYVALGNCLVLLGTILYSLMLNGVHSLIMFASLLILGCITYWYTSTNFDRDQSKQA